MSGTAGVRLRRYRPSDREAATAAIFEDVAVMRYVGEGRALSSSEAGDLFEQIFVKYRDDPAFLIWAIDVEGTYAGHAELKRRTGREEYEIVYVLRSDRWGEGVGGRVVDLLLAEARHRGIPFVVATIDDANLPSRAIVARRGFRRDVVLSDALGSPAYLCLLPAVDRRSVGFPRHLEAAPRRRSAGAEAGGLPRNDPEHNR